MIRSLFVFVLLFLLTICVQAQNASTPTQSAANCTQVLRLGRAVYEQGRLHELETLLKDCLAGEVGTSGGFSTTQEKVDAYRLLCLAYIYLEEPAKADQAMLGILDTDKFFVINPTDPAEFKALYRTFRTEPIFNWGLRVGGNLNMFHIQKVYSTASESAGHGKYKMGGSITGGAFIEKEPFPMAKGFLRNTFVRIEGYYVLRSNTIKYDRLWSNQTNTSLPAATSEGKVSNAWIDINAIVRYRYNRGSLWDPYFGLGPGVGLLMGAKLNLAKFEWKEVAEGGVAAGSSYSGPSVEINSAFVALPVNASIVWGVNRRFGGIYFNVEARYQYGFNNLINPSNRTIFDVNQYAFTFNDFNQSTFIINVGVTVPKFSPKKLSKKK